MRSKFYLMVVFLLSQVSRNSVPQVSCGVITEYGSAVNPNFRTTLLSGICTPNMVFKRDADEKKKKSVFREV